MDVVELQKAVSARSDFYSPYKGLLVVLKDLGVQGERPRIPVHFHVQNDGELGLDCFVIFDVDAALCNLNLSEKGIPGFSGFETHKFRSDQSRGSVDGDFGKGADTLVFVVELFVFLAAGCNWKLGAIFNWILCTLIQYVCL